MILSIKSSWNTRVPCNPIDSKDQGGEACEHGRLPRQHRGSVTQRTGGKGAETLRTKAKAGCSWMRSDAWECCWTFRSNNTYNYEPQFDLKPVRNMYPTIRVWMNWWCFSKRIHWLKWYLAYVQFQRHHHSKHMKGNKPHGTWWENSAIGNRWRCMPSAPEHRVVSYIAQQRHQPDGKTWNLPITSCGFWIHVFHVLCNLVSWQSGVGYR